MNPRTGITTGGTLADMERELIMKTSNQRAETVPIQQISLESVCGLSVTNWLYTVKWTRLKGRKGLRQPNELFLRQGGAKQQAKAACWCG